jgi:Zinc-finger associated domain (zf-AD)
MARPFGASSCIVVGCKKEPLDKLRRGFGMPEDPLLREVWVKFSRRGIDFKVKPSHSMCSKHFEDFCFSNSKLLPGSVPTIFYKQTPSGPKKVKVSFDRSVMDYSEADMIQLKPAYDKDDHEKELLEKRKKRLGRIERICRFCLDENNESKLVENEKLKAYLISIDDVYTMLNVDTMSEKIWSDYSCEECFQQIVAFDGFRKRCAKVQRDVVTEIHELNRKILHIQHGIELDDTPAATHSLPLKMEIETTFEQDLAVKFLVKDELKHEGTANEFPVTNFADDSESDGFDDDNFDQDSVHQTEDRTVEDEFTAEEKEKPKPVTKEVSLSITNAVNRIRIFECFFCNLVSYIEFKRKAVSWLTYFRYFFQKFAGKKIFKLHKCTKKHKKCSNEGCEKVFTKLAGYNAHISCIHKLPKVIRAVCTLCNFSMLTTNDAMKEHRRSCEKRSIKKIVKNEIECKECGKVCPNYQAFKVHSMFHQSFLGTNKTTEAKKKGYKLGKPSKSGDVSTICDECGKEFSNTRHLKSHIRRMHSQ